MSCCSTSSTATWPYAGTMNRSTTLRYIFFVLSLQRTSTCSLRERAANSATVTVPGAFSTGSCPLLIREIASAASRRAPSAVSTPYRPSVTRLDFPRWRVCTT